MILVLPSIVICHHICTIFWVIYMVIWGHSRAPQNVGVLAVLDFEIKCSRPEAPGFHLRPLLTKFESHEEN